MENLKVQNHPQQIAGNFATGFGWLATASSAIAAITPGQAKEWVGVLQFIAIGAFTLYLTLRKQYEKANESSLIAKIAALESQLSKSQRDRTKLGAATGVDLTESPTPTPGPHP